MDSIYKTQRGTVVYKHRPSHYVPKTSSLRKKQAIKQKAIPRTGNGSTDGFLGISARSAKAIVEPQKKTTIKAAPKFTQKQVDTPVKPWFAGLFSVQRSLTAMAVMLFVGGGFISWQGFRAQEAVETQAKTLARQVVQVEETGSTEGVADVPDEDSAPPNVGAYSPSDPLAPKTISIPSINVLSRVLELGVKDNGQLKAPTNIYDTGWYDKSSKPGKAGAVLIDGHVHGPTKPAVFYDVKNLKKGEKIEIERGDGKKFTYKVVKVETVKLEDVNMAKLLIPIEAGKKGLNLITCGGEFNATTLKYAHRVLVYAVQI